MNEITVITPPDILYNDVFSILLVCPNTNLKSKMHTMLLDTDVPMNIYIYDQMNDVTDLEWLIQTRKLCDIVILDIDNCDYETKFFASYLLGSSNTFYLTSDDVRPYNLISQNRIYNLDFLYPIIDNIRGKNEKK